MVAIVVGLVVGAAVLADWLLRGWGFVDGPALLLALVLIAVPLQRAHLSGVGPGDGAGVSTVVANARSMAAASR